MKLLLCTKCGDLFKLHSRKKKCSCKICSGKYMDEINVEVSGPCLVLGVDNNEIIRAIHVKESMKSLKKEDYLDSYVLENMFREGKWWIIREPHEKIRRKK